MNRIAIFASGNGSNAQSIIRYFSQSRKIEVECIVCNNPKAKVADVAAESKITFCLITKNDLSKTDNVLDLLSKNRIDFIVLAGFLWMIPENLLSAFPKRIINIHPALLPKHGGAGMYGMRVHEAVIAAKEMESGITIHYLNGKFDDGEIIFQKSVQLDKNETAQSLSKKVQQLEHEWYPKIIEQLLSS